MKSSLSSAAKKPRYTAAEKAQMQLRFKMARVLAETVAELKDNVLCRLALAFSGFSDEVIDRNLDAARHLARRLRANEINRRYESQWVVLHVG